ncbi:MAG: YgiQ family radical SAM protein [Oscillospiraceae bacterium]|nr:YgiQ family radical SAM protein [Oscillospiraceae bacterium]
MGNNAFLPVSKQDLKLRGIEVLDFICVTGDAYVDHPSFGIAMVSRLLESVGFTVGIIAQPVSDADFAELGAPRYCFMVSGGNIDSMVANYTVSGKKRHKDDYSAGGKGGKRPDYAVNVYCKTLKRLFPGAGIVIGGLEASLRRFAHYDFWADKVLPSVLVSSGADLLVYGMAELTLIQLAERLRAGEALSEVTDLRGICRVAEPKNTPLNAAQCDGFELVSENKKCYAKACAVQYEEQDEVYGKTVVQRHGNKMLVQNPPQRCLTESETDKIYALPFMRACHPVYEKDGGVPALNEVEFSITWTRGCFGSCNFCSIALHQGRRVQSRSEESVVREAELLIKNRGFKGYIHDVGGPTANFGQPSCRKQLKDGLCKSKKCLAPAACKNLETSHEKYLRVLRRLRGLKGVKKVFVRSGIRFDYVMPDKDGIFLKELVENHVSGQLKVAPEHIKAGALACMGKPPIEAYLEFEKAFFAETKKAGKEQYLVPYFMSSHPGTTLNDAVDLAVWLKKRNIRPEQVQDFYPTPGTVSTAMYYSGLDPFTLKKVYVPKNDGERAMQRALLQYYKPENRGLVAKALAVTKRKNCLVSKDNSDVKKILPERTQKAKREVDKKSGKKKKKR